MRTHAARIRRYGKYLWAMPNTLIGLAMGVCMLALGGRVQRAEGAWEFSEGWLGHALRKTSRSRRFCAITFGHTIIGVSSAELTRLRVHEQVHVRQYERWGPLFLPAYLLASLWSWWKGGDPYTDNLFEQEAFAAEKAHLISSPPDIHS